MNAIQQSPHDVDRMLTSFFKSEMPDPFPPFRHSPVMPHVASRNSREERRAASNRSRYSLAASVAILLGGCWYLSGQIGTTNEMPGAVKNGEGGSAKVTKELKKAHEDAAKNQK